MEGKTQQAAAAASATSERSVRRWQRGALPSERRRNRRGWRTRPDPFADVWERDVEPLLRSDPDGELSATTILEWLDERHSGRFGSSQLRTLQRRIRDYRALHGPDREVYFQQEHPPGREAQVDFTHCSGLGVTIRGETFRHLLFHLALSHSGWSYGEVASERRRGVGEGTPGSAVGAGRRSQGGAYRQPVGGHTRAEGQQGSRGERQLRGGPGALWSGGHQDQPEVIT